MLINATTKQVSNDAATQDRLLDDALHVAGLDAAVPDTLAGQRVAIMMGRSRRCWYSGVRRCVHDHVARPFVPADVRDRADVDWHWYPCGRGWSRRGRRRRSRSLRGGGCGFGGEFLGLGDIFPRVGALCHWHGTVINIILEFAVEQRA